MVKTFDYDLARSTLLLTISFFLRTLIDPSLKPRCTNPCGRCNRWGSTECGSSGRS